MADELRFDGRVVIVTGAGGGLGRSHALLFGARGAKVVVNDLGGGAHGDGKSSAMADQVVEEIRAAGGEAVASYDSVEDGDKIVQAALDAFGRLDVVVNNAGILRDVSFHKMTDADWDLVYRVHVRGSYAVTKAAWPHLRDQEYGRVVMTASAAGIYGNFGQANYAMAKLGLTGFANTLAVEGRKRGVLVNTIAPIAGSRLTETVLPEELVRALDPAYVSPLVAWLCHESCEENGGLFEVGGGYFGKLRWERTAGKTYRVGRAITPEDVRSAWKTIVDFGASEHPGSINESMQPIMANLQRGPSKGGNQFIDVDEALGAELPEVRSSYDEKDVALYALGVGAGTDPVAPSELRLVYEMDAGFTALPTFGVIPALKVLMENAKNGIQAPGLNYGFDRLLHGEQYTELKRPLPRNAKLRHRAWIKDIFDKGEKGAVVVTAIESRDEQGDVLIYNESSAFIRGAGGWGGERGPASAGNEPPARAPDAVVEEHIPPHQALLYRLSSGDWNPLHADPAFAKAFGFDRPILHGLCTFGYAGRHVISKMAPEGDPRYFKSIKVRFAKNVYPGDTLVTEMWREGPQRVVFRCKVKARDEVVISNAAIELYESIPKKQEKPAAAPETAAAPAPSGPTSADIFAAIGILLSEQPGVGDKVGHAFQLALTDPESVWTIDVRSGNGAVAQGETVKPDCTLALSDADFMDMCTGKADAQKLYFGGQLKITGNVMASQKLGFLKKVTPEMVERAMKARGGASGASAAPAEAKPAAKPAREAAAPALFGKLKEARDVVGALGGKLQFRVTGPEAAWVVDAGAGTVEPGEAPDAAVTITIADEDLAALAAGGSARALFQHGKLRVDGDVRLAKNLEALSRLG
ncbi:MAG: SDR family NAD(P)-dependent oxidoreductase [Sandaracinaceae bacterium]|nr:SDR family NAD(P)-dependent oxidoreductase [Sandaracinaceae bacterium]